MADFRRMSEIDKKTFLDGVNKSKQEKREQRKVQKQQEADMKFYQILKMMFKDKNK